MRAKMTNVEIAELLRSVAATYQIKDEAKNRFKIIAYERAADAVEHLSSEAKDLWDDGKLENVAGIGPSITEHLGEIFKNGKSRHFEDVFKGIPPAVFKLLPIEGIGPKTAFKLVSTFKSKIGAATAVTDLEKLAKQGEIEKLEGFGKDSQNAITASIAEISGREKRLLINYAESVAGEIIEWLKKDSNVVRADALGSLRRRASTIGDIDIAVASNNPKKTIEHFVNYPNANRIIEKGKRSAGIIVPGDKQVDLMVEKPDAYGALLQHFTGSKQHNIALREYSLKQGMSLSDYGIKLLNKNQKSNFKNQIYNSKLKIYQYASEEEFYAALGMVWIPPELREDTGEIEAALTNKVPNLVKLNDIKADLQIHSDFNIQTSHDLGLSTYKEIVAKADRLGYEYIAFTDHNPAQRGHSQDAITKLLERKSETVKDLNEFITKANYKNLKRVFNSLEIDILPDGRLPVPDNGLNTLDFALVSIHSSFRQDRSKTTARVIAALTHPKVKIFAHPTGRKLNEREGVDLDWEKIMDFCHKNNKWLEINADPARLDLPDYIVKEAVKKEVGLTLGTDSHHIDHMTNMRFGVDVARRGWAEKKNIVNSLSLEEFEKKLNSE